MPGPARYPTWGFKELALLTGATQCSYRKTADSLNRHRRQPMGGTPLNTLRDEAEAEGMAVLAFLDKESGRILKSQGFSAEGTPLPKATVSNAAESPPATFSREKVEEAWRKVEERMHEQQMSASHIEQAAQQQEAVYEDPAETVNIHVDDVGVKEQKEQRETEERSETAGTNLSPGEDTSVKAERKRPMVYNIRVACKARAAQFQQPCRTVEQPRNRQSSEKTRNELVRARLAGPHRASRHRPQRP